MASDLWVTHYSLVLGTKKQIGSSVCWISFIDWLHGSVTWLNHFLRGYLDFLISLLWNINLAASILESQWGKMCFFIFNIQTFTQSTCFNTVAKSLVILSFSHSRDPLFYLCQRIDCHYFSMDRERALHQLHEIENVLGL